MVDRNGEGAFAVGLDLGDGRVFLAVDKFSTETPCWRIDDGRLCYAGRADELAGAMPELDPQAKSLGEYLRARLVDIPRSLVSGDASGSIEGG